MKKCLFTSIELLIVVSIMAIRVGLLLPALFRAKYQAKLVVCGNAMRMLVLISITFVLFLTSSVSAADKNATGKQKKLNQEANAFDLSTIIDKGTDEGDASPVPYTTGLRDVTPEELAQFEQKAKKAKKIKLNKIGLARINRERKKKGKKPLVAGEDIDVAPVGAETEIGTFAASGTSEETSAPVTGVPSGVDNSTLKYFPPIRNQGSLNSCAQWAVLYYNTTHEMAMVRDWNAKSGGDYYRFTPMFSYNFVNFGENYGTWIGDAWWIAERHGIPRWSEFYTTSYRTWCTNPARYRSALHDRIAGYTQISNLHTSSGLDILKAHLANGHTAIYNTYINSWKYKTTQNDPGTTADDAYVGKSIAYKVEGVNGGHSMTIVGYNDDIWCDIDSDGVVDANEKGALRIANSWGTGWKEGGYCWIAYQALATPNTDTSGPGGTGFFWGNAAQFTNILPEQHAPTVVAKITINHNKRNQVHVKLGTGSVGATTPSSTVVSRFLDMNDGGPYAFSGAASASEDFTYYLDFTDLAPSLGTAKRWFVQATDSGIDNGNLTIKAFELYYVDSGSDRLVGTASNTPQTANGNTTYAWVDWTVGEMTPCVTVAATDADAAEEGPDTGTWTITRDGDTSESMTVYYNLSGTATVGSDYTVPSTSSITIPAGQASATVLLTPVDDTTSAEFAETAILTVLADSSYVTPASSATITIIDNDLADVPALSPVADTFIRGGSYAAVNYGPNTTLSTKEDSAEYTRRMYFKFDLNGISANITSAHLCLAPTNVGTDATVRDIYLVNDDSWTESAITYNNAPAYQAGVVGSWQPVTGTASHVDLTTLILSERNGDGVVSLCIRARSNTGSQGHASFASKEYGTESSRPVLKLTYGDQDNNTVTSVLAVDFSRDSDTPLQVGYLGFSAPDGTAPVTTVYSSSSATDGDIDVTIAGMTHWRTRTAITAGPFADKSDLLCDYPLRNAAGTMTLTLADLAAGAYEVTTYHHATQYGGAGMTLTMTDAVEVDKQIFSGTTSAGTAPESIVTCTFTVVSNGGDIIVNMAYSGGNNMPLNGFDLSKATAAAAPVASNDTVTTHEDTPVAVTLTATDADGDPLTYSIVSEPTNGTLSGTAPNVTYTPNAGFFGTDIFTFKANDGSLDSNVATISITINELIPLNNAPVIESAPWADVDPLTLPATTNVNVVAGDADGDALTFTWGKVSGPGTVAFSPNGTTLSDIAGATFSASGTYVLRVTVSDGTDTVSGDLTIVVQPEPNVAPVANNGTATTSEDTAVGINLTATDGDGDALSYAIVTGPASGTLSGTAPNLTYTPNGNYNGTDSFTFKANDGKVDSNTATVTITVGAVNDAPVITTAASAAPASVETGQGTTLAVSASDADGDSLSYTWTQASGPGTATFGNAAAASTTATFAVGGSYVLRATVTDGSASVTSDVTVTVTEPVPVTIHVDSILCETSAGTRGQKYGRVTVVIVDDGGQPVAGATVSGTFSGNYSETASGTTDAAGTVVFTTSIQTKKPSYTFTVTGVAHGEYAYDPVANVEVSDGL